MQKGSPSTDAASSVLCALIFLLSLLCSAANAQQSLPDSPKPKDAKTQTKEPSESRWPRTLTSGVDTFTVYPPQVDKWDENRIELYCAVELKSAKRRCCEVRSGLVPSADRSGQGQAVGDARQAKVTKVKFPVAQDKEGRTDCAFGKEVAGATRTISLDRLEAEMDADNDLVKGSM